MKKLLATCMLLTPLTFICADEDLYFNSDIAKTALVEMYAPQWRDTFGRNGPVVAFNHVNIPQAAKDLIKDGVDLVNEENRLRNALAVDVQTPDDAAAGVGSDAGTVKMLVAPQVDWATFAAAPEAARLLEATKVSVTRTVDGQETTQDYSLTELFKMLRDDETIDATWDFGGQPVDFLPQAAGKVLTPAQLSSLFQETVIVRLTKIANSATAGGRRAEKELRDIARKVTAKVSLPQGVKNKGKRNEHPKLIVHEDYEKAEDTTIGDLLATLGDEIQLVDESIKGKAASKNLSGSEKKAARKDSKTPIRRILKKYKGKSSGISREALYEYLVGLQTTLSNPAVYRASSITPRNFSFDAEARALLPVASAFIDGVKANPTLVPFMTILGLAPRVNFTKLDFSGVDSFDALFAKLNADLSLVGQPVIAVQPTAGE